MSSVKAAHKAPSDATIYSVVFMLCTAALLLLLPLQLKWLGWLLLFVPFTWALYNRAYSFSKYVLAVAVSIGILGRIPINTNLDIGHMALMGIAMVLTVLFPYVLSKRVLRDGAISFPFKRERNWSRNEVLYIFISGATAYLLLPFYLSSTDSFHNWSVAANPSEVIRLFIGTNALGIWDEVFFIGICLTIFRRYMPFIWANITQAVLWTSFLYELGIRGWWGPIAVFLFAFSQGYIFRRTKSMLYIITVHLTIDFVLFLTLVHLHHPEYLRIFITSPY